MGGISTSSPLLSIVVRSQSSNLISLSPISLISNMGSIIVSPQRLTMRIRRENLVKNSIILSIRGNSGNGSDIVNN